MSIYRLIRQIALLGSMPLFGQMPNLQSHFANAAELKQWAEKNSWGGCSVDVVHHSGAEAIIVRRSHTSGIQSCSVSVFVHVKTGLLEALNLRQYHGYWIDFVQAGDTVVLKSHTYIEGKEFEIMRFSIKSLILQSFEK